MQCMLYLMKTTNKTFRAEARNLYTHGITSVTQWRREELKVSQGRDWLADRAARVGTWKPLTPWLRHAAGLKF